MISNAPRHAYEWQVLMLTGFVGIVSEDASAMVY